MKTLLLILLAATLCFSVYAESNPRNGVWTAELNTDGTALQMTLFRGSRDGHRGPGRGMNNMMGFELSLASLTGLRGSDVRSAAANVEFSLTRPAGTIRFEGRFANGDGAGNFKFAPSDAFVREMASLGYSDFKDDDLLLFATTSFSPQTVRDLRNLGYQPTQKEIKEVAIFRVDAGAVNEYARLGYSALTLRQLIEFRIFNVTPAKIEAYKRLGYTLTTRELTDFSIHGVTAKSIEELRAMGYTNLTPHQLIEMRIFGVTPEYIRKVEANGYRTVPVDKLIKLRMSGADELVTGQR